MHWGRFGLLLAIYMVECVKYCLGTEIFFHRKIEHKEVFAIGFTVLTAGLLTADFGYEGAMLFMYGVVFAGLAIGMRQSRKGKGADAFLLILLMTSLDETISAVTKFVAEGIGESGRVTYQKTMVDTVIVLLILCFIKVMKKSKSKKKPVLTLKINILAIFCWVLTLIVIGVLNYTKLYIDNQNFQLIVGILVAVAYISFFILTWLLVFYHSESERTKRELQMEKHMKEQQVAYFHKLLEKEEETRKFRHDIGNHLVVLGELNAIGDMERVREYLEKMNGHLFKIRGKTYVTGNELLDIILSDTMPGVCKHDQVHILGEFHCLEQLEEMDLCTIFYNLFSNAKEALKKIAEDSRYFMIEMVKGEKNFAVVLRNPVSENVKMDRKGFPKTTKTEVEYHGLGLKNVAEVMKKNGGEMELLCEQKEFTVRLYFPRKIASVYKGTTRSRND